MTNTKFFPTLTLFSTLFTITLLGSCQVQKLPIISASETKESKEIQLGESSYYLLLPGNLNLSEARGKEGQLGYHITSKDSSSTMFGFIEILRGNPIAGISEDKSAKVFALANLLGKNVKWKMYQTETGYYNAFTTEKDGLNVTASSNNRTEIDLLISIFATLKRK